LDFECCSAGFDTPQDLRVLHTSFQHILNIGPKFLLKTS
jgi:hypothetical protein